jgi:hypothetical protein
MRNDVEGLAPYLESIGVRRLAGHTRSERRLLLLLRLERGISFSIFV